LSVEPVASRPGAAAQKLIAQVGLSCADSLKSGTAPARASKAATSPSSLDTRKAVGLQGFHAMASTSALSCQRSGSPPGERTSTWGCGEGRAAEGGG
jgi:hypothetical protein